MENLFVCRTEACRSLIWQDARHPGPAPAKHLGMCSPSESSLLYLAFRLGQLLFRKVGSFQAFAWVGTTGLDTKIHQNPNNGLTSACTGFCSTQVEDLRTAKNALGSYWSPETKFRFFPVHLHFYHHFIVNICSLISASPTPFFLFQPH